MSVSTAAKQKKAAGTSEKGPRSCYTSTPYVFPQNWSFPESFRTTFLILHDKFLRLECCSACLTAQTCVHRPNFTSFQLTTFVGRKLNWADAQGTTKESVSLLIGLNALTCPHMLSENLSFESGLDIVFCSISVLHMHWCQNSFNFKPDINNYQFFLSCPHKPHTHTHTHTHTCIHACTSRISRALHVGYLI